MEMLAMFPILLVALGVVGVALVVLALLARHSGADRRGEDEA